MKKFKEKSLELFYEELTIAENSKESYLSYVRNAIKHFEKHYNNQFDFYEKVMTECDSVCALLNSYLTEIKLGNIKDVSPKTAMNYSSAFTIYQDILSNMCTNNGKTLNNYLDNIGPIIYSKEEMIKIFLNRLVTQDRKYKSIKFPTRIINKVCPRGWFRALLKSSIERTMLYDGNGDLYNFNDIESIIILNSRVMAQFKEGKRIEVFSPNANYDDFLPFDGTKGIPELSLDHKNSLYDIIELNHQNYPNLKQLSEHVSGKGYKSKLIDNEFINDRFIDSLKSDVKAIIDKTQLVIMSKSLNSAKNANKIV